MRASPKRIATKYHYDEYGSQLFERITELEEYYPTRMERALLRESMPTLVRELEPATFAELGAGSAEKSRIVLDAMEASGTGKAYVPIDVSADFLETTAATLRDEYPGWRITPVVADFLGPVELPDDLPEPHWIAFLGSTLGNFEDDEAVGLLTRIATALRPRSRLLLGVDLRPGPHKSAARIEEAYNDADGVTAAFSKNILTVVNRRFGSDFDLDGWEHESRYTVERGRIETALLSRRDQRVAFPSGDTFEVLAGERIRTEISCKYDRDSIDALFERSGLCVERWIEDERAMYALVLASSTSLET